MTARLLIVVSGLAASSKTTIGRVLSTGLSLPLLDKDGILEALFDSLGCQDRDRRQQLSRERPRPVPRRRSVRYGLNWWSPDTAPALLASAAESLIEVPRECPIEVAARRFANRKRHPGHLDRLRTADGHAEGVRRLRESYRGPCACRDR